MPRGPKSRSSSPQDQDPYITKPKSTIASKLEVAKKFDVVLPTAEMVLADPSQYFILIDTRYNSGKDRVELFKDQYYRTYIHAIHRENNGLPPNYIKKFEEILKSPRFDYFTKCTEDDLYEDGRREPSKKERSQIRSFLKGLAEYLADISIGRSVHERNKQGIFGTGHGETIAKFIDLAKIQPDLIHFVPTAFVDDISCEYWGLDRLFSEFPDHPELFRMPIGIDLDTACKCALKIGLW